MKQFDRLSIISFCLLFCFTSNVYSTNLLEKDLDIIIIDLAMNPPKNGVKRSSAFVPIVAVYRTSLLSMEVSFLSDIGDVSIVMTNVMTGESSQVLLSLSGPCSTLIPIPTANGIWQIDFILYDIGKSYTGLLDIS